VTGTCSHAPLATPLTVNMLHCKYTVAVWRSGYIVGHINKVTLHRAGLVRRRVTVRGYTVLTFNQAIQANSAFHPYGVGKSSTGLLGWGEGGARSPTVSGGR